MRVGQIHQVDWCGGQWEPPDWRLEVRRLQTLLIRDLREQLLSLCLQILRQCQQHLQLLLVEVHDLQPHNYVVDVIWKLLHFMHLEFLVIIVIFFPSIPIGHIHSCHVGHPVFGSFVRVPDPIDIDSMGGLVTVLAQGFFFALDGLALSFECFCIGTVVVKPFSEGTQIDQFRRLLLNSVHQVRLHRMLFIVPFSFFG